jgi:hypothetical protein
MKSSLTFHCLIELAPYIKVAIGTRVIDSPILANCQFPVIAATMYSSRSEINC